MLCPACQTQIRKLGEPCPRCGVVLPGGSTSQGPISRHRLLEPVTEIVGYQVDPAMLKQTDPDRSPVDETVLTLETIARPPPHLDLPLAVIAPAPPLPIARRATMPPPPGPPKDPLIGSRIAGKYLMLELLAVGGMGKVYKARHLGLDRTVCVKTLKPDLLSDPTIVGRFEREAKAASRLTHQNAIAVFDFGDDGHGSLYLAMEFVPGRDLRTLLLEEFPLGEARICRIMAQVLAALADAHAQSVIHRDLKPENIMVESRRAEPDFVKVLDFGIAKILTGNSPTLTLADRICGTPLYMSPEQATGAKVDARADLYAVGVILYQLATGTLPFFSHNTVEVLTMHVNERAVPPRQAAPNLNISRRLEKLIVRAMSKDADDRPQSADAFRDELLAIAGEAHEAPAAPVAPPKEVPPVIAELASRSPSNTAPPEPAPPPAPSRDDETDDFAAGLPQGRGPLRLALAVGMGILVLTTLYMLRPHEEPVPSQETAPAVVVIVKPIAAPPPPSCLEGMALVAGAGRPFCIDRRASSAKNAKSCEAGQKRPCAEIELREACRSAALCLRTRRDTEVRCCAEPG